MQVQEDHLHLKDGNNFYVFNTLLGLYLCSLVFVYWSYIKC